ncbi:MAG: hypothetical protein GY839_17190 [candidate division Zixibacteria bacterium]|nr:hypothetical protein [candidate division Zixibacteria bacterium]
MVELTINFRCPDKAEKRAIYVLNLMASITGIRFKRVDQKADIIYGESDDAERLLIPCIEYEINDNEWSLFSDRTRLILPGFIQPHSVKVNESKWGLDIFYLAYEFLSVGLSDPGGLKWSPDKIRTKLFYIYPFFDSFINLLIESLKSAKLIPAGFQKKSPWPNGAPFALGLSHDLDILRRRLPGGITMLAKSIFSGEIPGGVEGSARGILESMAKAVTFKKNPYNAFGKWFDIEDQATYFIFAGKRHSGKDPTYKPPKTFKDLSGYDNSKYEIALHNGIKTWHDNTELQRYQSILSDVFNRDIKGVRPHFLDFRLPVFWNNLNSFSYSSSVGSDDIPGFTAGINFPFFGFDFKSCRRHDILEIPIGLMDCALFSIKDTGVRERTLNEIINISIASHGLLVLDWHNRTAYRPDFPQWFETYSQILDKAKSVGAYIAPLGEIDIIWRKHCESVFLC